MRSLILSLVPAFLSLALVACAADSDPKPAPIVPEHNTQQLVSEGGACHVSTDCQAELVCVLDADGDVTTKGLPVQSGDDDDVKPTPAPAPTPAPNPGGFGTCKKVSDLPVGSSCNVDAQCAAGLTCKASDIGTKGKPAPSTDQGEPTPTPAPAPAPSTPVAIAKVCSH
jgi:hypothetical protein